MNTSYDILVIGAGPAGAAAAKIAAEAGLRVGIVDKAHFPRAKLCGGLVTGRSVHALDRIFQIAPTSDLFLCATQIRFTANGKTLAQIADAPPMYLTMRWDFDAALLNRAIASGAAPHLGQPVRAFDPDTKTVTLRDGTTLRYRCLIAADGVGSLIAKTLFGQAFAAQTIGFGLEVERPCQTPEPPVVEVDFTAAQWGYGWSFPKASSQTIGVGGIKSRNPDLASAMQRYLKQTSPDTPEAKVKGHYLPFGAFRKTPGQDAILLVGDAAGLVDPITGEGIALALESGALAAQASIDALAQDAQSSAYRRYKTALKPIHRDLVLARRLRWLIFPKAVQPQFHKSFAHGSTLPAKFLGLLAGTISYQDLRSVYLRKLPKAAWLLIRKGFS